MCLHRLAIIVPRFKKLKKLQNVSDTGFETGSRKSAVAICETNPVKRCIAGIIMGN